MDTETEKQTALVRRKGTRLVAATTAIGVEQKVVEYTNEPDRVVRALPNEVLNELHRAKRAAEHRLPRATGNTTVTSQQRIGALVGREARVTDASGYRVSVTYF